MLQHRLKTIWKTAAEKFCLTRLMAQTCLFWLLFLPIDVEGPHWNTVHIKQGIKNWLDSFLGMVMFVLNKRYNFEKNNTCIIVVDPIFFLNILLAIFIYIHKYKYLLSNFFDFLSLLKRLMQRIQSYNARVFNCICILFRMTHHHRQR